MSAYTLRQASSGYTPGRPATLAFWNRPTTRTPRAGRPLVKKHAEQEASFTVGIGRETASGVPAETMTTAISSPTTVSWAATLHPFAREFPPRTDWIEFARTRDPTGEVRQLARGWAMAARAVCRQIPSRVGPREPRPAITTAVSRSRRRPGLQPVLS